MVGIIGLLMTIIAGFILLLSGRRLFWLFVGLLGFVVGFWFSGLIVGDQSGFWPLIIALATGLVGAWLAVSLQKIALAAAGFVAGGYVLSFILQAGGIDLPKILPWIIGGILGAVLLARVFDWALVFLSVATGAALLAQAVPVMEGFLLVKFFILFILGITVQSRELIKHRRHD